MWGGPQGIEGSLAGRQGESRSPLVAKAAPKVDEVAGMVERLCQLDPATVSRRFRARLQTAMG
jgi:hypothetical protein